MEEPESSPPIGSEDAQQEDLATSREQVQPESNTAAGSAADAKSAAAEVSDDEAGEFSLAGASVWVIDANSLIFQVFFALPQMTGPRGEPANALYGFTRDMLRLIQQQKPDYLFCAFDPPGDTFRHAVYDEYKANRDEMPDELSPQFPAIRRMLEALAVPILEVDSYEADDVLATLARVTVELGGKCVLVSGDKDCRQLIGEQVEIFNIRKNEIYNEDSLEEDWGIRPDQVVDFQSLVGDKVDNVPGVPLIGPKIAMQLLGQYETLEGVLDHAHEISGKKRKQNLMEGREVALLSRELVRLSDRVPLDLDWQAGRVGGFQRQEFNKLASDYGFRGVAAQFDELAGAEPPELTRWEADYQLVNTPEALADLVGRLKSQRKIAIDTETTSLFPMQAEVVGYAVAWEPGTAYYIPVRGPAGETCLDPDETLAALAPILSDPEIAKVGQNLKYDMLVIRRAGVEVRGVAFDTMVASYLLEAGTRSHNLDQLAARYLNFQTTKISELIGSGKNEGSMADVPLAEIAAYAGEDVDVPLRLEPILTERLAEAEQTKLFGELEMPLVECLMELEHNGIRVDTDRLAKLGAEYDARMQVLVEEVHELAGHEFNLDSPKQLARVLFEELGLPAARKTKSGPSTDASVLEELATLHPLPARLLEYRQFAKLKGTYVDALPALVNPETGRVHASFNQSVAATGRLSSSDPNLQNIPIRTERGREIRSAFLPAEDDWLLLAADYSQIELRVLAHFSADEALVAAFEADADIHTEVASQVFGVGMDEVTRDMRSRAKAVNFGVIYGLSAFGLSRQLGIEQEEAAEFIESYFARFPGVREFLAGTLESCREQGYVSTILGRRREVRGVRYVRRDDDGLPVPRQMNLPERTAVNTVVQGSAADLIKLAMYSLHKRLLNRGGDSATPHARMLLQIHDELIFEAPPTEIEPLAELVSTQMTGIMELRVPLKVDVKQGANWAELEPLG